MKAAIYARKSTDDDVSLDRQVALAKAFAESKKWKVVEVYQDNDVSGGLLSRPGIDALQAALKRAPRPFEVVVTASMSRLSRAGQLEDTLAYLRKLTSTGVEVWFYESGRPLKIDSLLDQMMTTFDSFAAASERQNAVVRTTNAMREKARRGEVTSSAPFGYRIETAGDDKRFVSIAEEAEVVRQIFALAAQGHGFRAIAKRLRNEGAVAPHNGRFAAGEWTPNGVRKVLYRETYVGRVVYGQVKTTDRKLVGDDGKERYVRVAVPREEWTVIEKPELRIVTPAVWQRAHDRLGKTRAAYLRTSKKSDTGLWSKYLLSGLLVCSVCGGRISSVEGGRAYACMTAYRKGSCTARRRFSRAWADEQFVTAIKRDVLTSTAIQQLVDEVIKQSNAAPDETQAAITAAEAKVTRLRGEIRRLTDRIAEGLDSPAVLAALKEREADLQRAQAHAEHVEGLAEERDIFKDPAYRAEILKAAEEARVYLSGKPDEPAPLPVPFLRTVLRGIGIDAIEVTPAAERGGKPIFRFRVELRGGAQLANPRSAPAGERAG